MKTNENQINQQASVNIAKWVSEGWDLVFANFWEFVIISIIYVIVIMAASSTILLTFLLAGPLTVGIYYVIFQKMRGQPIQIGDISKGFNFFVAAVLADILISVFVWIGFLFLIIPGIVISALYIFTFPLILEKNLDFWQAMETSRKVVQQNLFEFSVFMFLLYVFLFVGLLLLGVGFLVALPITFAATAAAYRDVFGLND